MKIYTRTGDKGDTGLFGGKRVSKHDLGIEVCGDVDELNCHLGLIRAVGLDKDFDKLLRQVQNDLFTVGADISTPFTSNSNPSAARIVRTSGESVSYLEDEIDRFDNELQPLSQFILPGGTSIAAQVHVARSVCRRAERRCSELAAAQEINPEIVRYLNRFSDLLFIMARTANARAGIDDIPWTP